MRWLWLTGLLSLWPAAVQADALAMRLRLQLGEEYDTNAPRENITRGDDDFLTRMVLQGQLRWRTADHFIALDYHGGAKLFYDHPEEHLLANNLQAEYRYGASSWHSLGALLSLKDVSQAKHDRDYTLSSVEAYLRASPQEALALELFGGGRHFAFKPDWSRASSADSGPAYSHLGPTFGLRLSATIGQHWRLGLNSRAESRYFQSEACRLVNTTATGEVECTPMRQHRRDERYTVGGRVRFQAYWWRRHRVIAEGSYWFSLNDSNTAGGSASWHRFRGVISVQLPAGLALHLMGTLQLTGYPDGVIEEDRKTYMIDADENENSLVAKMTFRLWDELHLLAQAAVYRNTFTRGDNRPRPFGRETFMLGLSYDWSFPGDSEE